MLLWDSTVHVHMYVYIYKSTIDTWFLYSSVYSYSYHDSAVGGDNKLWTEECLPTNAIYGWLGEALIAYLNESTTGADASVHGGTEVIPHEANLSLQ